MQKVMCSVRDIAADVFSAPFTSQNTQTAMRDFAHATRDPESQLCKNPEDFQLYQVATFDDDLGIVVGITPQLICNATQFVKGE